MSCKKTERFSETWFFKWILNNQAVVSFLILLLICLLYTSDAADD